MRINTTIMIGQKHRKCGRLFRHISGISSELLLRRTSAGRDPAANRDSGTKATAALPLRIKAGILISLCTQPPLPEGETNRR